MIVGRVNNDLEAIVGIVLQDSSNDFHTFQCVLDTEYDGFLALPVNVIEQLGLVPRGHRIATLVNSNEVSMPVYLATVDWHGEQLEVSVLQTEHEFLVGAALLENCTVTIQVWDGGEVLIEERS